MIFLLFRIAMFFINRLRRLVSRPARFLLVNSVVLTTLATVFGVLAVSGYIAAYRALIPTVQIERDVHFKMRPCKGIEQCQHPIAEVWLADVDSRGAPMMAALSPGTDYRIELSLELPESKANFDIGMFMVTVEMRSADGEVLRSSQRSAVLIYRSYMLRLLNTMLALPSLLFSDGQEKQLVRLTMFESFMDLPRGERDFAALAYIELHSTDIQIYSAKLRMYADFGGLRYLMYSWPLTSAGVCCAANFVALWIATAFFWVRSRVFSVARTILGRNSVPSIAASKKKNADLPTGPHGVTPADPATTNGKTVPALRDAVVMNGTTPRPAPAAAAAEATSNGVPAVEPTELGGNTEDASSTLATQPYLVVRVIDKVMPRLPLVGIMQPLAARLVDMGLRWSPVPIPGPIANIARQLVSTQKYKIA